MTPESLSSAIVERLKPMRFQPTVRLEPVTRPHALLDTKFGGPYHIPAGKNPPRNLNTQGEMALIAQLNFDQLPKLSPFPEHGLLQFFIDPNPNNFRAFFHPTDQISWRIRYIPETPSYTEVDTKGYMPDIAGLTSLPFPPERYLPMTASSHMQMGAWNDFPFNAMLSRYCADLIPTNPSPADLDMLRIAKQQAAALLERDFKPGSQDDRVPQLGGHPTFTRPDPRAVDPESGLRVPTVCLLQIPCFDGLNWGGEQIVHFFISQKDLRNKDFNHVLFDMI